MRSGRCAGLSRLTKPKTCSDQSASKRRHVALRQATMAPVAGAMVMQGQQYGVGRRIDITLPLESTHHCAQPIFVTNPGSGRKALYVASQNSMWIEGIARDESEVLLQQLFAIAEDPAIIYEHVWRPGDLVMWDNLACLHARVLPRRGQHRIPPGEARRSAPRDSQAPIPPRCPGAPAPCF